jgi:NTP-dependent ternary system trypsin peptidase co-occuring protein
VVRSLTEIKSLPYLYEAYKDINPHSGIRKLPNKGGVLMKSRMSFLATFLTLGCLFTSPSYSANQPEGTDVTTVVQAVRRALKEAQSNNVEGFPGLKKAEVELSSTVTKDATGKIKFLVFSIGGSKGQERSATLTVELAPPSTVNTLKAASVDERKLLEALARAITAAKVAFVQAREAAGNDLSVADISMEIKFGVKTGGQAGADTAELLPIGFELSGTLSKDETHTVKLTFGK